MKPMQLVVLTSSIVGTLWARPAAADVACRTVTDTENAVLHLDGFTPSASTSAVIYFTIGNTVLNGTSVVAACVGDIGNGTVKMYPILDAANARLPSLPKTFSHLCLTAHPDEVTVVQTTTTACGASMTPLKYNGNTFVPYGRGGNDVIRGGNGSENIYGGAGADSLTDYFAVGANPTFPGSLLGESGDDRLFGSPANTSNIVGGPGNDGLWDLGGGNDLVLGEDGNECCMFDSTEQFLTFNCGLGTDRVQVLSPRKLECEVVDPTCTALTQNSACFPH